MDYLKKQHGHLQIGNRADNIYKETVEKINDKAMPIHKPKKKKKGLNRRVPTQTSNLNPNAQSFVPNQNFDPDDPMNWISYNPAYDDSGYVEKGPE